MSQFSAIQYSSYDGLTLFARDYPSASGRAKCPVICIHGLTRNSVDFAELAPWIASLGRRVLAVDIRGRGRSDYDPNLAHYNPITYYKDVLKLMRDLGLARAVFVGTSMGGIIAMVLALWQLNAISAVIFNDVGPVISPRGVARIASYLGTGTPITSWAEAIARVAKAGRATFPSYTDSDWEKLAHRTFVADAQGYLVRQYDPNIVQALRNSKFKHNSLLLRLAFRRLARNRPTLLIRGALSDILEPPQLHIMQRIAPSMQYVEIPNVGHVPSLMETVAQDAMRNFLAQVA